MGRLYSQYTYNGRAERRSHRTGHPTHRATEGWRSGRRQGAFEERVEEGAEREGEGSYIKLPAYNLHPPYSTTLSSTC